MTANTWKYVIGNFIDTLKLWVALTLQGVIDKMNEQF